MKSSRSLAFWLGTAIGVAFLVVAARSVDSGEFVAALRGANFKWSVPFLLALLGFYALKAIRWGVLLRPVVAAPFRLLFRAVMIGYASNAVLPAQLGDVVRALVASREMGLRISPLVTTVVVERAFDLIVVAGLLAIVVFLRPDLPPPIVNAGLMVAAGCAVSLLLLHLYARQGALFTIAVRSFSRWFPEKLQSRLLDVVRSGADGAAALAEPNAFAASLAITLVKWLLMAACNQISLLALGISAPPEAALLVLACTVLALMLPSAPGYVGAIQIAYVIGLAPFGVSATEAVAASAFFHVLSYLSVVAIGFAYLHRSGYRFADLRTEVERRA